MYSTTRIMMGNVLRTEMMERGRRRLLQEECETRKQVHRADTRRRCQSLLELNNRQERQPSSLPTLQKDQPGITARCITAR